jgi:hypothetical protein
MKSLEVKVKTKKKSFDLPTFRTSKKEVSNGNKTLNKGIKKNA